MDMPRLHPCMYAHKVLTMTEAFAQIITEEKNASGMTWAQIAKASGMSVITVKRIAGNAGITRSTPPDVEQLTALARALGANGVAWFGEAEARVKASHTRG